MFAFTPYVVGIDTKKIDLNRDPNIRARLTKKYRYMTLDKWLHNDLKNLLSYLVVQNEKVDVLKNIDMYDPKSYMKDSDDIVEKKIKFIEDYFLTQEGVYKILKKINRELDINWIDFPHNETLISKYMKKFLKEAFKNAIMAKK